MVPPKRRKVSSGSSRPDKASKFPQVVSYLLERKMGSSRRTFLTQLGRKKGFRVDDTFSESVTHVVSEKNTGDDVRRWLTSQGHDRTPAHLVDVGWLTDSLGAGHPVDILERHKLREQPTSGGCEVATLSIPVYACQRRTALNNNNAILTDALSLLAENAELCDDDKRGLAFRRGAAVLRSLPEAVTNMRQLRGCPCLGEHSLKVIQDILETGASCEVESTKQSERYQAMKVLTGIFGVGVKTADQWFRDGIQNLHQLRQSGRTLNRAQRAAAVDSSETWRQHPWTNTSDYQVWPTMTTWGCPSQSRRPTPLRTSWRRRSSRSCRGHGSLWWEGSGGGSSAAMTWTSSSRTRRKDGKKVSFPKWCHAWRTSCCTTRPAETPTWSPKMDLPRPPPAWTTLRDASPSLDSPQVTPKAEHGGEPCEWTWWSRPSASLPSPCSAGPAQSCLRGSCVAGRPERRT
ncbi:DNA-directed DNA/RNA polymerase mu isoform X5 [Nerophis ophidion]|uniref:DNA-directed DNA/RNA polymerase mu isoform X5 n=1 Tax=Nerophis ophidion TaxID=159077 RepID=UPI002AE01074|nr:DNA-directed DNA/RNA polymerase mu isoform X5 [Nerophis ophidion]